MEIFWIVLLALVPIAMIVGVWFFTKKIKPDAQHGAWKEKGDETQKSQEFTLIHKVTIALGILFVITPILGWAFFWLLLYSRCNGRMPCSM